jgi:hypothetical protein
VQWAGRDAGLIEGIATIESLSSSGQRFLSADFIGIGRKDTQIIAAYMGRLSSVDSAAQRAAAYSNNRLNDWYLPSLAELNQLYSSGVSGIASGQYWSSSQRDEGSAWFVNFANGNAGFANKSTVYRVRAIRAF